MHVMISVVGKRTEHWISLFAALAARPDVSFTILAADVSDTTRRDLDRLSQRWSRLRCHVVPHRWSEDRTGHMASVLFPRDSLRALARDQPPDVIHVIGEAAYLSTWQILRLRRRYWPDVPVTLYAAQNVVIRFPLPFPLIERYAYRAVDHIFPITPAALNVLRVKGYRGGPASSRWVWTRWRSSPPRPRHRGRSRPASSVGWSRTRGSGTCSARRNCSTATCWWWATAA